MTWRATDPQGNEAAKVKYDIVQYTRGEGIDIGCGPHKAFPHFVGVDSGKDTELFGIDMKPDVVCEDATRLDCKTESLDFVFSSHLLEHIQDTNTALTEWWRVLKVGGYLVLYLPHKDLYPNVGTPGANPDHKHDFRPEDIFCSMGYVATGGFDMVVREVRSGGLEYSFLQVFQKRDDGVIMASCHAPKPEKSACVVRYGGFGDSIQAANILPELKRQGYHVTFMTTPRGQDILKHDPHIDAWLIQDENQVPNQELVDYWAAMQKRFTKFINLCESVEGTLIAMPGRANHLWPDNLRRQELNKNYLEWTAKLAELPYTSEAKFYASEEESSAARRYLSDIKNSLAGPLKLPQCAPDRFNILWCLAGSSMHKFYPNQDAVIYEVLNTMPEAVIVFSGDYACKLLEIGWENTPRIKCESGVMGIRETLTLAQNVDCVVGPETGVLNAVAFEHVGKVIMLSHSSHENLTKHWKNTTVLEPANTACYPCHRLHYGKEFCFEDKNTGAAICQKSITYERVVQAIKDNYSAWKEARQPRIAA